VSFDWGVQVEAARVHLRRCERFERLDVFHGVGAFLELFVYLPPLAGR
jgi:hypothetical protein